MQPMHGLLADNTPVMVVDIRDKWDGINGPAVIFVYLEGIRAGVIDVTHSSLVRISEFSPAPGLGRAP